VTAEEILALPERGLIAYREEFRDGRKVRVPYAERAMVRYIAPDDVIFATDANGHMWTPFTTESGTYRRRVS
jgi:hypothetical protein